MHIGDPCSSARCCSDSFTLGKHDAKRTVFISALMMLALAIGAAAVMMMRS